MTSGAFAPAASYRPPAGHALTELARAHPRLHFRQVDDPRSSLDNRTLVRIFLRQRGIEGELFERLVEPYDLGFYRHSDGKSTPFAAMRVRGRQRLWGLKRDLAAVRHDLDYYRGWPARQAADAWYYRAQLALGEAAWVARAEHLALRAAGWLAWYGHARQRARVAGYGTDAYIASLPLRKI